MGNPITDGNENSAAATALPSYPGGGDLIRTVAGQALALRGLSKSFGARPVG